MSIIWLKVYLTVTLIFLVLSIFLVEVEKKAYLGLTLVSEWYSKNSFFVK